MASFESLSDLELRKKLLDFGYDLPVSINRDFLLKKLRKVTAEGASGGEGAAGGASRRKSTPANSNSSSRPNNNTTNNNRLSLNETGLRQRQGSKEPEVIISKGRKSTGSILGTSSPANPPQHRSSLGSTTTTTSTSRSGQRQTFTANQSGHVGRLNRVAEVQEREEENGEEEDEDDEDEEEEEDMDIDEGIDLLQNNRGVTYSRGSSYVNSNSPSSSHLTKRNRESRDREETFSSDGGGGDGDASNSSSRFQSYLNYFKGDTRSRSDPLGTGTFESPSRTGGFYTPSSSPYSLNSGAGSQSFRRNDESSGDEDEEEEGEIRESRMSKVLNKVNPVNWYRNAKFSWFSSNAGKNGGSSQTESYSYNNRGYSTASLSSGGAMQYQRYSSGTPTAANGNWGGATNPFPTPSASLGNRKYSPVTPPPVVVPPQVTAGRQAGFKAFFSRGERNGYGYTSAGEPTTDWASSSHLISKIILTIFILTFLGIGGRYYYISTISIDNGRGITETAGINTGTGSTKSGIPPTPTKKKVISTSMVYPICGMEGVDPEACVPKDIIRNSNTLLAALQGELIQRSKRTGCGGQMDDIISLESAKTLLYRLTNLKKPEVDSAFQGMLLLVTENLSSGLKIESTEFSQDEEISSRAVQSLDYAVATITAVGIPPHFMCVIYTFAYVILSYIAFFVVLVFIGYVSWIGIKYKRGRKLREDQEVYGLIEKVLQMLYLNYEHSKTMGTDSYLAVNHIRDELLSSRDRVKKEALWNRVVEHISTNESRVRAEVQHISGEEFRVWRWLNSASPLVSSKYSTPPSSPNMGRQSLPAQQSPTSPGSPPSLYPSLSGMDLDSSVGGISPMNMTNKWQGQAFEICDGSPNALPVIPTTCLKIRQMFDTDKDATEPGQNRIERAILEKLSNSKILHIGIESGSQDGCVYVLCQSKEDARAAYMDLHGWWFDGHLLSVKFLREQRYFARFPDAKNRTVPMTISTLSSPAVQPLAGQQTFSNSMNIRSGNNNNAGPAAGPGTSARVRYTMGY